MLPGSGGFSISSTEYLTSPASSSLPLWNLTPRRRLKVIDFWSAAIFHDSARAGLRFRFRSHSTRESYAACLPQWFEVRIAPNGATCTGSCSSAKVIRPPRRGACATDRFRAAVAEPATEPAATAPAATTPALTSASRRVSPPSTELSVVSLSATASSLLWWGQVTGSARLEVPRLRCRRRRRTRGPECWRAGSRPRGRSRLRGRVRP